MEVLFDKSLPVHIKKGEREESQTIIGVSILHCTSSGPLNKKELIVRLTDENDPFFLYTLTINEEDFQSLKAQQGLLVDFTTFPQKFVDLLQLCLGESKQDSPKFILQFTTSKESSRAFLNVVETNLFRHLTHLALSLVPASDSHLKKYLAECLLSLKEEVASLAETLKVTKTDLTSRLAHSEEVLSHRTRELEKLKSDWSAHTISLTNDHTAALTTVKEKSIQTQLEIQRKFEKEKKEMETSYTAKIESLEDSLKELDTTNKDLTDRRYRSEAAIRELKAKLKGTEEELSGVREELLTLRKDNSNLDSSKHELNKLINNLQTRVAVLEQELKDKEQVVHKTNDLLSVANEQKHSLEVQLEQSQRQVLKLDTAYKQTANEVTKGNEIIQKLQSELKSLKSKMKLRNMVTTQQEKLINDKEVELNKTHSEVTRLSETLTNKEKEREELERELLQLKEQLKEQNETLKNNENIINWLNKQINDQAIARVGVQPRPLEVPHPLESLSAIRHSTNNGLYQPQFSSTPLEEREKSEGIKLPQKVLFRAPPLKKGLVPSPLSSHSLSLSPSVTTPSSTTPTLTTPITSRQSDPQLDRYLPPVVGVAKSKGEIPSSHHLILAGVGGAKQN